MKKIKKLEQRVAAVETTLTGLLAGVQLGKPPEKATKKKFTRKSAVVDPVQMDLPLGKAGKPRKFAKRAPRQHILTEDEMWRAPEGWPGYAMCLGRRQRKLLLLMLDLKLGLTIRQVQAKMELKLHAHAKELVYGLEHESRGLVKKTVVPQLSSGPAQYVLTERGRGIARRIKASPNGRL